MSSVFGVLFRVATWGESHGGGVGAVVDGCPPRIPLTAADIQADLDRRRPGQSEIVSPRDPASGLPTGKRIHKPISITKQLDATTPLLLNALVDNENLTSVLIGLMRNGQEVATIKLTNASISSYVANGGNETWSFTYQNVTWTWLDDVATRSQSYRVWGNPRSTFEVAGSGQRDVTTLPRV